MDEQFRDTSSVRRTDVFALVGALAGATATTALIFTRLAPFNGVIGFVVVDYVLFLALYALLVSFDENGLAVRDRLAAVVVHSLALLVLSALVSVVTYTLWRARTTLPHLNLYTQDMSKAGPVDPVTVGGVLHAMAGTLIMIAIALAITVPLGIVCAVFLSEIPGPFSRFVRTIVEAMTALPSIVAGLFVYVTVVVLLGVGFSGIAAGLAISVMMLPIVIRSADVVLRLVPGTLKEASYALGAGQWRTVWHVTLPTARSGLTTAVILGTARGIGETSPVLLTAGLTPRMNLNPLEGPMVSLPLATLTFVKSPQPEMVARGFGAAAVLMILVLILFAIGRALGRKG
ncbi:phosphate ABC transporter permease PstA [Kribbella sp. GL6]|uniref:phosphate ABC transporter permease PstA n=1 Tax=Kribbella sp. GL6 TaxID=3419765 RepID=UPI003D06B13B